MNGTLNGFFKSSRGFRQGYPLSPSPFVFVMEAFNKMILGIVGKTSNGTLDISHRLFADDTIMFCEAIQDHIRALRALLFFEAILGLQVNLAKSEMVSVGNVPNMENLAFMLGCKVSSLQMK